MRTQSSCTLRLMTMLLTLSGCVRLDEDHCIVNGGDFACDVDHVCVTEIDSFEGLPDDFDGCTPPPTINVDVFYDHFVRVEYGLPEVMWPRTEPNADDVRSLGGVLLRTVQERGLTDVCEVESAVVQSFELEWAEVDAVREFLDRPTRVRADAAALAPHHLEAIEAFGAAINGWLEECEQSRE